MRSVPIRRLLTPEAAVCEALTVRLFLGWVCESSESVDERIRAGALDPAAAEVVRMLARQYGLMHRLDARAEELDRFYRSSWPAEMRTGETALSFAFTTAGALVWGRMEEAPPIDGGTAAAIEDLRDALLDLLRERGSREV